MNVLDASPEPLTPRQRYLVIAASAIAASSRLLAVARTPWDWDEMLFLLALRDYDVAAHHPHPPGFPLFVGAARLARLFVADDFHALQLVVVAGAMAIVPAVFLFCREARLDFPTSFAAASITAFFPNVWFYGGTGLSDVPSLVAGTLAAALLLRGARDRTALLAGAALAGIAASIRPQNALVAAIPFVIACWRRRTAAIVLGGVAVAGAIVLMSYGVAAWLTGVDRYFSSLASHGDYIRATDTIFSATRPSPMRILDDFFFRPYRQRFINGAVAVLSLAALPRLRMLLVPVVTFAPVALFTWLLLDHHSAGRFALAFAPLNAILAAAGLGVLVRHRQSLQVVGALVLCTAMAAWTWPALRVVRSTPSPPVAAAEAIRGSAASESTVVYVDRRLAAYADYYLHDYPREQVTPRQVPTAWRDSSRAIYVTEGAMPDARRFTRPREPLWNIARRRYFDVAITNMHRVEFGGGWYREERRGESAWRWMSRSSTALLPPSGGEATLRLLLHLPVRDASIEIRLGPLVDRFRSSDAYVERVYRVAARQPVTLTINADRWTRAPGDPRELGARLDRLEWTTTFQPGH